MTVIDKPRTWAAPPKKKKKKIDQGLKNMLGQYLKNENHTQTQETCWAPFIHYAIGMERAKKPSKY